MVITQQKRSLDEKYYIDEKWRALAAFVILRLLLLEGQKFKVKRLYCVAMDTTSSKMLIHPFNQCTFPSSTVIQILGVTSGS